MRLIKRLPILVLIFVCAVLVSCSGSANNAVDDNTSANIPHYTPSDLEDSSPLRFIYLDTPSNAQQIDIKNLRSYNEYGSTSFRKEDDTVIIDNRTMGSGSYYMSVKVKPETVYRLSADVRIENYDPSLKGQGGISVGFGYPGDNLHIASNDFVISSDWQKSQTCFYTGPRKSVYIRVSNGGNRDDAYNKGTAYAKNIVLEELPDVKVDNKWNVLVLICGYIDTGRFVYDTYPPTVSYIRNLLTKDVKQAFYDLSDGKMEINRMDVVVDKHRVASASKPDNGLTFGAEGDIDLDRHLKYIDYDLIYIIAPFIGIKGSEWLLGTGANTYTYNGKDIQCCQIYLDYPRFDQSYKEIDGKNYNIEIGIYMHEALHCVERKSDMNGYPNHAWIHDFPNNGYGVPGGDADWKRWENDWIKWYHDIMTDKIRYGARGFTEGSYLVQHYLEPVTGNY